MYPDKCHDPYLRRFIRLTKSLSTDYDGDVLWLRKGPQYQPMVIAFNLVLIVSDYLSCYKSSVAFDMCNIVLTTFEQTRLFMVIFDVLFTKSGSTISNGPSLIGGATFHSKNDDGDEQSPSNQGGL